MRTRRLLLVVAVVLAPLAAACSASPTGLDDSTTPAALDSTTVQKEQHPWG